MTNYNAIAASPTLAAGLAGSDIIVLGNPDSPVDNKATNITQLAAKINTLNVTAMTTTAGAGITSGVGTIYTNSVQTRGTQKVVTIFLDLTGLASSTTDLDIIGVGASAAHLGRILAAELGIVDSIRMTCLELPAGGVTDIDLYSATESTGVFDGLVTALTETALITAGAAWTNGMVKGSIAAPAANQYLYLTCGTLGVPGTYTAGQFLLEIFGH